MILAFRDIQWQKTVEQYLSSLNSENSVTNFIHRKLTLPSPPLLAKLDGNAENATGDVITRAQTRFFLLEFKSSLSKAGTESDKFIYHLMHQVDLDDEKHRQFVDLSKAGHFFVFGKKADAKQQALDAVTFGEGRALALTAYPYLNVIRKQIDKTDAVTVEQLLLGNVGWEFTELVAYLSLLSSLHGKATGSTGHAMKVAIATQNGVFWPFGDLSDVLDMARIFQQTLNQDQEDLLDAYNSRIAGLKPFYQDILPKLRLALVAASGKKKDAGNKPPRHGDDMTKSKI